MTGKEKKPKSPSLTVLFLGLSSAFLIYSIAAASQLAQFPMYLPIIINEPTPTPTSTPIPTPIPGPQLNDGYYLAEFSNGGFIQFTIANDGSVAKDAGFVYKAVAYVCPWVAYSFYDPVTVENGGFRFVLIDQDLRVIDAELTCKSLDSNRAFCTAGRFGFGYCGSISGIATRR